MKKLFFTMCLISSSLLLAQPEKDYAQPSAMSRRIQVRLGNLWTPGREAILLVGFSREARDNWFESIKELRAYFNKTKPKESFANKLFKVTDTNAVFNEYLQELEASSIDLFNGVQFIRNLHAGRSFAEQDIVVIKNEKEKLQNRLQKIQGLIKKISGIRPPYLTSTKEIKDMFLKVAQPFANLYEQVIEELKEIRRAIAEGKIKQYMQSKQSQV